MRVIASKPLMSGRRRSISVMSGRCVANRLTASAPVAASATSCMSACVASIEPTPSRKTWWSSTVMIRIGLVTELASIGVRGEKSCPRLHRKLRLPQE